MLPLICWLICGYCGFVIAESKGRNPLIWATICFAFSILGVILVAVLPNKNK